MLRRRNRYSYYRRVGRRYLSEDSERLPYPYFLSRVRFVGSQSSIKEVGVAGGGVSFFGILRAYFLGENGGKKSDREGKGREGKE